MYVTSKNLIPLLILDILNRKSDYDHPLKQEEIIDILVNEYNVENVERKAIGRNVQRLVEELDYDIQRRSDRLLDKEGFYLATREFDHTEVRMVIDSILSNEYISDADAKDLAARLANLMGGEYYGNQVGDVVTVDKINKTTNREVFYNMDVISRAIESVHYVRFEYYAYAEDGRTLEKKSRISKELSIGSDNEAAVHETILPLKLVNRKGRYYVIGQLPFTYPQSCVALPLDRLKHLQLDRPASQDNTTCDELKEDDIRKMLNTADLGWRTEDEEIRFVIPARLADNIYSRFGKEKTQIMALTEDILGDIDSCEPMLQVFVRCEWAFFEKFLLRHFADITLITPRDVRITSIADRIARKAKKYL